MNIHNYGCCVGRQINTCYHVSTWNIATLPEWCIRITNYLYCETRRKRINMICMFWIRKDASSFVTAKHIKYQFIYVLSRLWKNITIEPRFNVCMYHLSSLCKDFREILLLVTSMKVPWETPNLVKIGQNIWHLSWRILLPEIKIRHKNILCDI